MTAYSLWGDRNVEKEEERSRMAERVGCMIQMGCNKNFEQI